MDNLEPFNQSLNWVTMLKAKCKKDHQKSEKEKCWLVSIDTGEWYTKGTDTDVDVWKALACFVPLLFSNFGRK